MADEARPTKDDATAAERQTDKALPVYYTNSLSLVASVYDFTFVFGHKVGPDGEADRGLAVVMSPQHAAALALVLEKHLKTYEGKFGKIQLPDDLLARIEKAEHAEGDAEKNHA